MKKYLLPILFLFLAFTNFAKASSVYDHTDVSQYQDTSILSGNTFLVFKTGAFSDGGAVSEVSFRAKIIFDPIGCSAFNGVHLRFRLNDSFGNSPNEVVNSYDFSSITNVEGTMTIPTSDIQTSGNHWADSFSDLNEFSIWMYDASGTNFADCVHGQNSIQIRIFGQSANNSFMLPLDNNPAHITPAFWINGVPPPEMTITSPPTNAFLNTNTTTPVSGSCVTNGSNQLEFTYTPFLARLDPTSAYNIDCSAGTYSANITPRPGQNTLWVVDKSAIGENPPNIFNTQRYASLIYTGITSQNQWAINLITPQLGKDNWLYLSPANPYVFRFSVLKPPGVSNADITMGFKEFTDFNRTTASSTDEFIGLDSITVNGQMEHYYNINASTTPTYYRVYLKYASTTPVFLDFNVRATTDTTQYPVQNTVPPNGSQTDLGFWGNTFRYLFVPDADQLKPLVVAEESNLAQTIPFSYFYQAKAILETQSIATATPTTINLIIPSGPFGNSTTTAPLPIFGSVATDPVRNFSSQLRGYVTAGIWLAYLAYVIKRFADLLST